MAASKRFLKRTFRFAAIDCTEDGAETCAALGVKSYPTFLYFNEDDDPLPCFETKARSSGDFITFVWDKLFAAYPVTIHSTEEELLKIPVKVLREHLKKRGVKCVGCTDKRELVSSVMNSIALPLKIRAPRKTPDGKPSKSLMQEKREAAAVVEASKGFDDGKNGAVVHKYTDDTLNEHVLATQGKGSLVYFFAPWCQHCSDQRPGFVEASEIIDDLLEENNIQVGAKPFVAVNCDIATDLCQKFNIDSYPKYKWIEKVDDLGTDFPGGRDSAGFSKFVAEKFEVKYKPVKEFIQELSSFDFGSDDDEKEL